MDAASQSYFAEVAGILGKLSDAEDIAALCGNALKEVIGGTHAYSMVCEPQQCYLLERLIQSDGATCLDALDTISSCLKSAKQATAGREDSGGTHGGKPERGGRDGLWKGRSANSGGSESNGRSSGTGAAPSFSDLCTMPAASRVIEACFSQIRGGPSDDMAPADKERFVRQVGVVMTKVHGAIRRSVLHVMCSPCGSHVLRSMLRLLDPGSIAKKNGEGHKGPNGQQQYGESSLAWLMDELAEVSTGWAEESKKRNPNSSLKMEAGAEVAANGEADTWRDAELEALGVTLALDAAKAASSLAGGGSISDSGTHSLCCNTAGSPVLQVALQVLASAEPEQREEAYIRLFAPHKSFKDDHPWKDLNQENVLEVAMDRVGSRFVEAAVRYAPQPVFEKLFEPTVKGRLADLAVHGFGNFVVQAYVQVLSTSHQLKRAIKELRESIPELLVGSKGAVAAALLSTSQKLKTYQGKVCDAILAAARALSEEEGPLWNLMWLTGSDRSSLLGCMLVQLILTLPQKCIDGVEEEIGQWNGEYLRDAAMDPRCSRVLDFAFRSPSISPECKLRIVHNLKGKYLEVARSPVGCHVVQYAYEAAEDLGTQEDEELIVSEVSRAISYLQRSRAGLQLTERLRLSLYRENASAWRKQKKHKEALVEEFLDILQPEAAELKRKEKRLHTANGEGVVEKKRKKKRS